MGWEHVWLLDGYRIPEIGYGSWLIGSGSTVVDQVEQALEAGFNHLDTAQIYKNESEVGEGLQASGLERKDVWVTTKWSGKDGKGIRASINESLEFLKYVDLYLIHSPRLVKADPVAAWEEMLVLKKEGLAHSVGVSNYEIEDLEMLREAGLATPVVNQILLHPYVYERQKALLAYHEQQGIVTEAYSTLYPLTHRSGGPLDKPLRKIAKAHSSEKVEVTEAEVLFAWARSKGAVIVTTTRSKKRLQAYLRAGDLELTEKEIATIDSAGAQFKAWQRWQYAKRVGALAFGCAAAQLLYAGVRA
ncbi:BQ2448_5679 [Microbotryum intermedium]|uniref:BQ2448_5679 protein n=1 Tax=Microbotryum intermedium TaxID=269621 RepID=A0A238F5A0_9BASI|nr:BQ2448_5679 [Microbotryum intermedium]